MKSRLMIMGLGTASLALALARDTEERRAAVEGRIVDEIPIEPQRPRDYDIEGPIPKAGPPTAREADMPSRQQRRWQERQNKKAKR